MGFGGNQLLMETRISGDKCLVGFGGNKLFSGNQSFTIWWRQVLVHIQQILSDPSFVITST